MICGRTHACTPLRYSLQQLLNSRCPQAGCVLSTKHICMVMCTHIVYTPVSLLLPDCLAIMIGVVVPTYHSICVGADTFGSYGRGRSTRQLVKHNQGAFAGMTCVGMLPVSWLSIAAMTHVQCCYMFAVVSSCTTLATVRTCLFTTLLHKRPA